jgi:hypothetical protein
LNWSKKNAANRFFLINSPFHSFELEQKKCSKSILFDQFTLPFFWIGAKKKCSKSILFDQLILPFFWIGAKKKCSKSILSDQFTLPFF